MAANPMKIRANNKDGVTEVKVLISHEMETGQRKDASGAIVPAWFITDLTAKHNDRLVLGAEFGTAVSKNPYLAFRFKGGAKGDKVSVAGPYGTSFLMPNHPGANLVMICTGTGSAPMRSTPRPSREFLRPNAVRASIR